MHRMALEPGKRGGRPCIRGWRTTVVDVLSMLSSGMRAQDIQYDFAEPDAEEFAAVRAHAADRAHPICSLNASATRH
ncbi:hypothetical protein os1_10790 [Comamonadaceae bacterium OS-1]|nr:hypothetical protein os1_10790 [Comamonadaceae bacterium OS-1]